MPYIIAVSGKGGTGKTTIAALILRALLDSRRQPVFAVDADPNACLGLTLNVPVHETIGDLRDDILEDPSQIPAGMSKSDFIDYRIRQCVVESPGFDLITMGRPEGPKCYCYINTLLRHFLDNLDRTYRYVIVDNEAGMEHLSRRTTRDVDLLLVVSDQSAVGLRSAVRIKGLADGLEVNVRQIGLVLNRGGQVVTPEKRAEIEALGLALWGVVPSDPAVLEASVTGESLLALPHDTPALAAVRQILQRVWNPIREAQCVSSVP